MKKEYLDSNYVLRSVKQTSGDNHVPKDWIEIPDGAIELTVDNSKTLTFWKDEFNSLNVGMGSHWVSSKSDDVLNFSQYSEYWYKSLWQREKIDVGETDLVMWSWVNGAVFDEELKHSHYKKYVSNLEFIDVYRVLDLFEVKSHAVGHAVKKLLCSGERGVKSREQDIQEAIDSLNRELEMMRENNASS